MDYQSERNHGCRIREFCFRNTKLLSMENNVLKITIIVDKGADIYEIIHKPTDTDFLWKTTGGIKDRRAIPLVSGEEGTFMDHYEGGWQEALPGGGPYEKGGARIGLHGEACMVPWDFRILKDEQKEISVELNCRTIRYPFRIRKTVTMAENSSTILFEETVKNTGNEEVEFMWGQHPAVGKPFLNKNCKISVPAKKFLARGTQFCENNHIPAGTSGIWPFTTDEQGRKIDLSMVPEEHAQTGNLIFLSELSEGWFAVNDTKRKLGYGMRWDKEVFPYVWYWQQSDSSQGYPWYSSGYNIALEIWNAMPSTLHEARKTGTLKFLKGGEQKQTSYSFTVLEGHEEITGSEVFCEKNNEMQELSD